MKHLPTTPNAAHPLEKINYEKANHYGAYFYRRIFGLFNAIILFGILSKLAHAQSTNAYLNDEYNSFEFYGQTTDIDTKYDVSGKALGAAVNFKLPVNLFHSNADDAPHPLNNLFFRLNYNQNDIDDIDNVSVKALNLEIDSMAFKIGYVLDEGPWHFIPFLEFQNGDLKDAVGDLAEIEAINYGITARRLLNENNYFDIVSLDVAYRHIDSIKLSRTLIEDATADAYVIDPNLVKGAVNSAYWIGIDLEKEVHPHCYVNLGLSTLEFETFEARLGVTAPF